MQYEQENFFGQGILTMLLSLHNMKPRKGQEKPGLYGGGEIYMKWA